MSLANNTRKHEIVAAKKAYFENADINVCGVCDLTVNDTITIGVDAQQPAIVALLDNSGGAANDTIAVITNAANAGSADVGPTADAIADLAAKVNEIINTLQLFGITQ